MEARPDEVYPVSAVTRYLRELLDGNRHLTDIWVEGEVSNLSQPSSGHIFFTLTERRSGLRCVFFRNRNIGQRDRLSNGAAVVVHGSLSLYEQRGELSFQIDFVQPAGTGALAAEFERRKAQFEAEGLFAPERKRALPRFPRRIGVVTSPTGAVFHDIASVLARRWPAATLLLRPAPVQGPSAAVAIAEALGALARDQAPDVIILARGGGADEELRAFNEEPVVRAIFSCPIPVVSAIGHETDTTLADLVADVRAPTPSAAAELVAPDRAEVARAVDSLRARGEVRLTRQLAVARESLDARAHVLRAALPSTAEQLGLVAERVATVVRLAGEQIARSRERTAAVAGRLAGLSPVATLERGYAVVERPDGTIVTTVAGLADGDHVKLRLRDGHRAARVEPDGVAP